MISLIELNFNFNFTFICLGRIQAPKRYLAASINHKVAAIHVWYRQQLIIQLYPYHEYSIVCLVCITY